MPIPNANSNAGNVDSGCEWLPRNTTLDANGDARYAVAGCEWQKKC